MEYRVWRHGDGAERSKKPKDEPSPAELALEEASQFNEHGMSSIGQSKIELGLFMSDMNQTNCRKEMLMDKSSDRQLIQQVNQNPFMVESNYIEDLTIQEQFLRPRSSNIEFNNKL